MSRLKDVIISWKFLRGEVSFQHGYVLFQDMYFYHNTAFKALSSKHTLLIKCYILKIIPPNTVIKYTHLKYSDRMIELQIAINVLRRYYLFLYEKG